MMEAVLMAYLSPPRECLPGMEKVPIMINVRGCRDSSKGRMTDMIDDLWIWNSLYCNPETWTTDEGSRHILHEAHPVLW